MSALLVENAKIKKKNVIRSLLESVCLQLPWTLQGKFLLWLDKSWAEACIVEHTFNPISVSGFYCGNRFYRDKVREYELSCISLIIILLSPVRSILNSTWMKEMWYSVFLWVHVEEGVQETSLRAALAVHTGISASLRMSSFCWCFR